MLEVWGKPVHREEAVRACVNLHHADSTLNLPTGSSEWKTRFIARVSLFHDEPRQMTERETAVSSRVLDKALAPGLGEEYSVCIS